MISALARYLRQPYGILLPWMGVTGLLAILLLGIHLGIRQSVAEKRARMETEWTAARQRFAHHREAKKAQQDLSRVFAVLLSERDFAPLALGITEEAKQDRVTLPALSYMTEKTTVANTTKAVLQGSISGRYEDLRKFIYDLETAEELLMIEDLDLVRTAHMQDQSLTFHIKIATYLRGGEGQPVSP